MRNLWREAGVAALVCGTLTACASPAYPINPDQAPGPAPLTMGRPAYPISESASPPAAAEARPPAPSNTDADDNDGGPPLAAPTPKVDSEPLPAPGSSASNLAGPRSDGARLQLASMTTEAPPATTSAAAPVTTAPATTTTSAPTATAPVSTALPPPAPAAAPAPAADATPTTPAPAAAAEPALTPRQVVHDQSTPAPAPVARPAPVREATATTRPAPIASAADPSLSITGDVVSASGGVFQNYEVQRGDHIDSLARAFSTSRQVLLDANHLRPPFVIHPGQIMKVPVAKAYVARTGDSLPGVARRFSVSVDELADLNHVSARAALRPGQEIGLPSSMRDRGPLHEPQYAAAPAPAYRPPAQTYRAPPPTYSMTPETGSRYSGQIPAAQPSPQPPRPTYGYQTSQPPAATQAAPAQMSDTEIAQAAKGRFVWPLRGDMMLRFGSQGLGRRNDGIDIRASQGTPVKAAASGEVVYAGNQVPGFGNLVLIKHPDGWVTAYAHLDQLDVQMKQQVSQGQAVGSVGTTGGASEPELHFEVRYAPTPADKARPVDPVLVLPLG